MDAQAVVKRFFELSATRDAELMRPLLDASVEWHNTRELPGGAVHVGPDAVERTLREQADAFEDYRADLEETACVGDQVVARARIRGRVRGSSDEVELRVSQIWTVRGGRIVRFRPYLDPDEAQAVAEEEAAAAREIPR